MIGRRMTIIYKYQIDRTDRTEVPIREGARIIHAGLDPQERLCVWAEVDPYMSISPRFIHVIGTRNPMPSDVALGYIMSVLDSPFVWHVYEEIEAPPSN